MYFIYFFFKYVFLYFFAFVWNITAKQLNYEFLNIIYHNIVCILIYNIIISVLKSGR